MERLEPEDLDVVMMAWVPGGCRGSSTWPIGNPGLCYVPHTVAGNRVNGCLPSCFRKAKKPPVACQGVNPGFGHWGQCVRVPRWNGGLVSILVPEQIIIADALFVGHEMMQFPVFIGCVDPATTFDALPDHQ